MTLIQCRRCAPSRFPTYIVAWGPTQRPARWSAKPNPRYKPPAWQTCAKCAAAYCARPDWCWCADANRNVIDVVAERARFMAEVGESPEQWLARWTGGQIERNGVNYTRSYLVSMLTGEPATWGSTRST